MAAPATMPGKRESQAAPSGAGSSIDMAVMRDLFDGDVELLGKVIKHFLTECPRRLSEVRSAVARRDGKALEFAAHSLKGSGSLLGATALCDAARRLEGIGCTAEWNASDAALAALDAALECLMPALGRLASETP